MTGFRSTLIVLLFGVCSVLLPAVAGAQEGAGAASGSGAAEAAGTAAGPVASLLETLRDPASRDALIAELERIVGAADEADPAEGAAETAAAAGAAETAEPDSLGRRIAETTQAAAEEIAAEATRIWSRLMRAPRTLSAIGSVSPELLRDAALDLALVIAATVAIFLALRSFAKRLFRSLGEVAADAGAARTAAVIALSVAIDMGVVLLAWAGGYVVGLTALGSAGEIALRQTLYLNAFLLVETARVVIRAVISPTTGHLRLVPIPDAGAATLSRWLGVAASVVGYGQLLVVPIVNQNASWFAGRGVSTLASLIAVGIMVALTLRHRRAVADWLAGGAGATGLRPGLARVWHWAALAYLIGLLVIVLTRPGDVLLPVLLASARILAAVVIGAAAVQAIGRATARGVRLPESVNESLPLLERRLDAFVPKFLLLLRLGVAAAVLTYTFDTLGITDFGGWFASPAGARLTGAAATVLLVLLFAFAAWLALSSWVDWRLRPTKGRPASARERTLLTLLRNAATIVILVLTLMVSLSELGLDIAPLLASAGVLGLAIGFGAQKMVQDIITGVFIQFENAMNVGDVVTVGGTTGVVEKLTIRSVSLRDLHGVYHIIPFSSVDMVSNYNRDYAFHVADMGIAYREDVTEAKTAMFDAFEALKADPDWAPHVLEDLQWFGVNALGDSAVVVRARIKCAPGQQWGVGRAYNELCKRIFDERGIEIPFPHTTVYFGEDKRGHAPPARIASVHPPEADAAAGGPPDAAEAATAEPRSGRTAPPEDESDARG